MTEGDSMERAKKQISFLARWAPWFFLALSIGLIVTGIIREEHAAVLKKAINICLECIGIG